LLSRFKLSCVCVASGILLGSVATHTIHHYHKHHIHQECQKLVSSENDSYTFPNISLEKSNTPIDVPEPNVTSIFVIAFIGLMGYVVYRTKRIL
jgi:hypothetical protein